MNFFHLQVLIQRNGNLALHILNISWQSYQDQETDLQERHYCTNDHKTSNHKNGVHISIIFIQTIKSIHGIENRNKGRLKNI